MTDLITTDLVRLDAALGSDKHDVIRALAAVVDDAGRASDKDQLIADAFARESTSATGSAVRSTGGVARRASTRARAGAGSRASWSSGRPSPVASGRAWGLRCRRPSSARRHGRSAPR